MQSISHLFDQALAFHQSGNFQQAEQLFRQILQRDPTHASALQQLGVLAYQVGRSDLAVDLIQKALQLQPEYPAAHNNLANILRALGRLAEATAHYREALRQSPQYAEAYSNLGVVLKEQGRIAEAIVNYRESLRLKPDNAGAHSNLGNALAALGQHAEAIVHFHEALRLKPDYVEAMNNLGIALAGQEKYDAAIASYRQALQRKPGYVEAMMNLGNALRMNGQVAEAIGVYEEGFRLKPDHSDAHNGLGNAYRQLGRLDEAIRSYRQALRLKPAFAEGYDNLGLALQENGQLDDAILQHQQCLSLRPDYAEAHSNMGNALRALGRYDEAMASYDRALQSQPDHAAAHFNRSSILLLRGNFAEGWSEYAWRWRSKPFVQKNQANPSMFPIEWDGSPLQGRTILLHAEQGLGDTIHLIRYATQLKERGAVRVILACPPALVRLMERCPGVDQVVKAPPFPPYEIGSFLMSLPRHLGTTSIDRIPANVPYLECEPELIEHWQARLAALDAVRPRLRVGIAWQGSTSHGGDRWRSVPLTEFAPLARVSGVSLISLQKGDAVDQLRKMPGLAHDLGPELGDLADTAALMRSLDLVISVDTAIVHLAGALGVPVWVAVPKVPDWRWLLDRDDSPWYPSMRLFRQAAIGQWAEVFERIRNALASYPAR